VNLYTGGKIQVVTQILLMIRIESLITPKGQDPPVKDSSTLNSVR